jgi:hypothetical protein
MTGASQRRMSDAARSSATRIVAKLESAIESILHFSEVAVGLLAEVKGMVGSDERALSTVLIALNCNNFTPLGRSSPRAAVVS